jgi:CubicO group peptidase (beta-lactamase class C family)
VRPEDANPQDANAGAATSDWRPTAPAEAGFPPDLAARLAATVRAGRAPNLHGVVVLRHGRLVLEHYGAGEDRKWSETLGPVAFGPATLHDLRSVTKSVVGLLYGIALAQGRVPPPEAPLLRHFPEYPDLAADAGRARLTVEHALTMTLGLEWREDVPYTSAANSEVAMELRAPDRYRFVLERPVVEAPGARWRYSGGASALVGGLVARGTGQPLPAFARDALFGPLGIPAFEWLAGRDGVASAASGLRLTPRALARIGQTVLARGRWAGREVVPAAWLAAALRPRVPIAEGLDYGYQWYLGVLPAPAGPGARPLRWVGGSGNGGQRLVVVPDLELVVAITAGNYDTAGQAATPSTILNDVILASIQPSR